MSSNDPYNLRRFLDAQSETLDAVCSELRAGQKQTHWMWFIFPQITGLGQSEMAIRYAISSRHEAEAYLSHTVLGPRLCRCTQLVIDVKGRSIGQIFEYPDDLKFRSCMTLFADITSKNQVFTQALRKYFEGKLDKMTLDRLRI